MLWWIAGAIAWSLAVVAIAALWNTDRNIDRLRRAHNLTPNGILCESCNRRLADIVLNGQIAVCTDCTPDDGRIVTVEDYETWLLGDPK